MKQTYGSVTETAAVLFKVSSVSSHLQHLTLNIRTPILIRREESSAFTLDMLGEQAGWSSPLASCPSAATFYPLYFSHSILSKEQIYLLETVYDEQQVMTSNFMSNDMF